MKNLITLFMALCILSSFAQAQDTTELKIIRRTKTVENDEMIIKGDNDKSNKYDNFSEFITLGKNGYKKSSKESKNRRRFEGHWSGFRYGFTNFATNDYSAYPEGTPHFMDLDWSNSFNMQFNVFQHSINLVPSNNFGFVTGIGLEYQRLRFQDKNISIIKDDDGMVMPISLKDVGYTNVKRNSLKVLYLTIPVIMEVQFPTKSNKRLYISGGVTGGIRLHSKTKIVYNDDKGDKHKKRETDNFNIIPFKADVVGAIGYRGIQIWGSYTLTHLFKNNRGPELNAYTFGIGYCI